eukprot:CAMPEP_0181127182 /NCGR_PEP_ID=MMETSP1071-20121207/28053_1 /TAXON_ID=35127 /ORGANISM="Thalassiosira sp., Strain NH16" /LENGTH=43 /DNA_ID= /DNA_START= /DNA_END= /DNA_ORIENTATION=
MCFLIAMDEEPVRSLSAVIAATIPGPWIHDGAVPVADEGIMES